MFSGVKIFFYDRETIEEFENVGLFEVTEVIENYPFHIITCRKDKNQNRYSNL